MTSVDEATATTVDGDVQAAAAGDTAPPMPMPGMPDMPMMQAPQWQGCLVPEGVATGDGREFADGSLSWVDPPMPLRWQKEGAHGGDNDVTVQVGLITRVWRDGTKVMGEGHFDLGGPPDDDAHEAFRRMGAGTCSGVSIDADDITNADIEYVFPESDQTVADDEDGSDILFQLFQPPDKIIFHAARIRAATLCDIPAFVEAQLHLLTADEVLVASAAAADAPPAEPVDAGPGEALVAHAWHDEWRPPTAWFDDPKLGQPMPIIITAQGRIYGHAANWGQCHLGYMNECVMPPFEDYHSHFRTGEVIGDDGTSVAVGPLTAGIAHAALTLGAAAAKQHYDNTECIVGWVATGNDKHGIWVAGAIRPDAKPGLVTALRGSGQVSPDWRRIGGKLRMLGLLTVNVSGYQVPRPAARSLVAGGAVQSLVIEGMVPITPPSRPEPTDEDLNRRAMLLVRQQLAARVHPAATDDEGM